MLRRNGQRSCDSAPRYAGTPNYPPTLYLRLRSSLQVFCRIELIHWAQVRKQRKEDLEKHVEEVNRLVRQANGDLSEAGEEDEDSENEEWNGIVEPQAPTPSAMDINEEEEFVDEDKYTTITIESVGISKHGFEKRGGNEEAEEEKKDKRVWTKERPKSNKPKKKKIKFRYETKTERKVERVKQGLKKKKMAAKRMAD